MKYHELSVSAARRPGRVGRGISAGQGKTAGRGTKGQNARTGKKLAATFAGGQGSLVQRIPKKKGFRSLRVPAQVVYLQQLNAVKAKEIDATVLYEAGIIATPYHAIKLIVRGELTAKPAVVRLQGASASAAAAIVKNGGVFEAVQVALPSKSSPAAKTPHAADKK